jgi:hypothetical protein
MNYQPNIKYLLLDVCRLNINQYNFTEDNHFLPLVALNQDSLQTDYSVLGRKIDNNLRGQDDSLRRLYRIYASAVFGLPEYVIAEENAYRGPEPMLENKTKTWLERKAEEAHRAGLQEGLHLALKTLLSNKFPEGVPPEFNKLKKTISETELLKLINRIASEEEAF